MKISALSVLPLLLITAVLSAQPADTSGGEEYLSMRWREVATRMPADWYGTDAARQTAENVLLAQREIGGWAKNTPYHHLLSEEEKADFINERSEIGATFDNGATTMELRFLAKVFDQTEEVRYREAFDKGVHYILEAQYDNGGWPQFYPVREGKSVAYSGHITYNDNSMVNIMRFLQDVLAGEDELASMPLDEETKAAARLAVEKGVGCILQTQIVVDGQPTVWCAQHDAVTLAPAKARRYELPSFSGSESAEIVLFLMQLQDPSEEVIAAVEGAVNWFQEHQLEGIRVERITTDDGQRDRVVVQDPEARPIWARFYDLETTQPFFCDRDGIKKYALSEIGHERRNGYGWYTYAPDKVLDRYEAWRERVE